MIPFREAKTVLKLRVIDVKQVLLVLNLHRLRSLCKRHVLFLEFPLGGVDGGEIQVLLHSQGEKKAIGVLKKDLRIGEIHR